MARAGGAEDAPRKEGGARAGEAVEEEGHEERRGLMCWPKRQDGTSELARIIWPERCEKERDY